MCDISIVSQCKEKIKVIFFILKSFIYKLYVIIQLLYSNSSNGLNTIEEFS